MSVWSAIVPIVALCQVAGADSGSESVENTLPVSIVIRFGIALVISMAIILFAARFKLLRFGKTDEYARSVDRVSPITWFVGSIVLLIGVSLLAAGIAQATGALEKGPLTASAVQAALLYGLGVPVSLAVQSFVTRRFPGNRYSLRWSCLGAGLIGILLAFPLLMLAADSAVMIQTLISGQPPDPIAHPTLELMLEAPGDWRTWIVLAGAVIGAPIFEETVYRGLMQTSIVSAVRNRWIGILLTSAVFALSHRGAGVPWHALIPIFTLGSVCGFLMEKRGLGAAIVAHGVFNASQVVLAFLLVGSA